MSWTFHAACVPPIVHALSSFQAFLLRAQEDLEQRNIDQTYILSARIAPDMFSLTRQVQIAADIARRGAIRLSGQEPSSVEDTEQSFAELAKRIERSIHDIKALPPASFEGGDERVVQAPAGKGKTIPMPGASYLMNFVLPNLHFHMSTTYNILRQNGVPLGKRDYLGAPSQRQDPA